MGQLFLPDRHPVRDFFVLEILDVAPRSDMASMEHPLFSLSTKPETRELAYEHDGIRLPIPRREFDNTCNFAQMRIWVFAQLYEGESFAPNRLWTFKALKAVEKVIYLNSFVGIGLLKVSKS